MHRALADLFKSMCENVNEVINKDTALSAGTRLYVESVEVYSKGSISSKLCFFYMASYVLLMSINWFTFKQVLH